MKIRKKGLLYDIANMAYVIADTGDADRHVLHQVRDICEEGNIDRVSRVLGLAYSQLLAVMIPVIESPRISVHHDFSATPHDYEFRLRTDGAMKFFLTKERQLKIKETCHEYMVCMVLADWLGTVFPIAADVWKFRMEGALESLKDLVNSLVTSSCASFRRKLSPF